MSLEALQALDRGIEIGRGGGVAGVDRGTVQKAPHSLNGHVETTLKTKPRRRPAMSGQTGRSGPVAIRALCSCSATPLPASHPCSSLPL